MNPISLLFGGTIRDMLDRVIPDPAARAAAELEVRKLESEGTFEQRAQQAVALAQIDVNKADAAGASPMQRNWRPMVGWVCAGALAWDMIGKPMVGFAWSLSGHVLPPLPTLDTQELYALLFSLLGLGTLRTAEKIKGAA